MKIKHSNSLINNHLTFTFISDIHGHFQKTENLRSYIDSSDLIFCLGDLDEYNKFTQKAKDFLNFLNYTKKLRIVSGNTDPTSFQEYLQKNPNLSLERREKNEFNFFFCGFGGIVSLQETIRRIRLELDGKSVSEDTMTKLNSQYDNALFFINDNGKLKTQPENDEMIGIWKKVESKYIFKENEIYNYFSGLNSNKSIQNPQIWMTHQPPSGFPNGNLTENKYLGSLGLYKAIKEQSPFLVASGHIHTHGFWKIGQTMCVSVPPLEEGQIAQIHIAPSEIEVKFIQL